MKITRPVEERIIYLEEKKEREISWLADPLSDRVKAPVVIPSKTTKYKVIPGNTKDYHG